MTARVNIFGKGSYIWYSLDPSFNIRHMDNRAQSDHAKLSDENIDMFCNGIICQGLWKGDHSVIFYSFFMLKGWYRILAGHLENVKWENNVYRDNGSGKQENFFKVESTGWHFIRSWGNYNSISTSKELSHSCMIEFVIHFWPKDISQLDSLQKVEYNLGSYVP